MRTDAELVKACLDGEKEAFGTLVERYERPVRAIALGILRDYHIVGDVSQESFVAAYQKLSGLRKAEAFGPWLMKITRRCALDTVKRRTRRASLDSAINVAAESTDGRLDEDKQRLLAAVMKLPRGERQVVMLRYFSGCGVRDVSDIVGRSVGTVTKQLSRAHKRLRRLLKEFER
ncbi:MAG: sigma-70 family RNA polymerase sigma factor [Planctomycetota bacterium]|nr:MAG: sigma-70 family RNA polymerase sigma factor [Planctomycetota bacterium]